MTNIPRLVSVSDEALDSFQDTFQEFIDAQRDRLEKDKQFLEGLELSDVQQVVSATVGDAVQLANDEIESILRSVSS